jgi:hypothetical protein
LNSDEQTELAEYQSKLADFRKELKRILAERHAEAEERRRSGDNSAQSDNRNTQKTPQAPKKPSFCSEEATTQYIFDGWFVICLSTDLCGLAKFKTE